MVAVKDKFESLDGTRKVGVEYVRNGTVVVTSDQRVRYPVELSIRDRGPRVLALVNTRDENDLVYATGAVLHELRRIVGTIAQDVLDELKQPPGGRGADYARLGALRGL